MKTRYELHLSVSNGHNHYTTWQFNTGEEALIELARLSDTGTDFKHYDLVQINSEDNKVIDTNLICIGRFCKAIDFEKAKQELQRYAH